ncbi:hypothetical protein [Streptomyces scabiei]|uniref:hypothetical protein n=1 Tax=Streptomyces scabiei TaxID=1930 RepID=UPI00099F368A|nr:hypothetical protein [Streptomyces scabiei]
MSRALPKYRKRRVALIGGTAAVVLSGAVIAGSAMAGQTNKPNGDSNGAQNSAASTVNCPNVASQISAVPAAAQAEVNRNLELLNTQIEDANKRLANAAGQGGANFVQNAVLSPLKDKRVATIDRIVKAAGDGAANLQVDALATCTLNNNGAGNAGENGNANGNDGDNCAANAGGQAGNGQAGKGQAGNGQGGNGQAGNGEAGNGQAGNGQAGNGEAGKGQAGNGQAGSGEAGNGQASNGQAGHGQAGNGQAGKGQAGNGQAGNGQAGNDQAGNGGANAGDNCGNNVGGNDQAGNAGNNGGGNQAGGQAGAANTVNCPDIASRVSAVPAAAQAEVNRNLGLLKTQIEDANKRLANAAGQGGANFVQNAVLNPLKDKRVATIDRIVNAIGGTAAKQQVDALATCTVNR